MVLRCRPATTSDSHQTCLRNASQNACRTSVLPCWERTDHNGNNGVLCTHEQDLERSSQLPAPPGIQLNSIRRFLCLLSFLIHLCLQPRHLHISPPLCLCNCQVGVGQQHLRLLSPLFLSYGAFSFSFNVLRTPIPALQRSCTILDTVAVTTTHNAVESQGASAAQAAQWQTQQLSGKTSM